MTEGGRRGDSKYRSAARHPQLGACESARGPDADRYVKLLIQFAVEGSLSGAYSQPSLAYREPRWMNRYQLAGCSHCQT